METSIIVFGEAEKGEFEVPHHCSNLYQLVDRLGNPPEHSLGLFFAVQSILYAHPLFFFRVREEGFSERDYLEGVKLLKKYNLIEKVVAICLPGVGSVGILEAVIPICLQHNRFLITTESDLFDYLTA